MNKKESSLKIFVELNFSEVNQFPKSLKFKHFKSTSVFLKTLLHKNFQSTKNDSLKRFDLNTSKIGSSKSLKNRLPSVGSYGVIGGRFGGMVGFLKYAQIKIPSKHNVYWGFLQTIFELSIL